MSRKVTGRVEPLDASAARSIWSSVHSIEEEGIPRIRGRRCWVGSPGSLSVYVYLVD